MLFDTVHPQNQINLGGKCGVCGDPWQAPVPRASEVGGRYVSATWRPIVGNYTAGQVATFVVEITANHKGEKNRTGLGGVMRVEGF